ncbi:hypothetical protein, variant 1 [Verruconis gallopava]|uniref:Uncharacterized protein n=1 Tax=Verruconis gallopava TaxID=253628 RepID=A0A0D1Y192_9PEZI|nr:hypothetical protein, variant 1 [Verruconis gallopava]KIW08841.1 hypothetical protein, variant 1 [Verruconis gallopava]
MNTPGSMVGMTGGAVGAPVGSQVGAPNAANSNEYHERLNTYIYDHLLKQKLYDLARQFASSCPIKAEPEPKKEMNGDDGMDMSSKDDIKRPDDLPVPNIPPHFSENSFLFDWWCQFWDIFGAYRGKGQNALSQNYLQHTMTQAKARQNQQNLMGVNANMMNRSQQFANMQTNGMNNMQKQAIANRGGMQQMLANKMQQNNMQDGDRPQSPGSMGNAPSPSKRPRLDDGQPNANGQPFPAGRGQPMPGNQMANMPGGPNNMMMQNAMPADMNQLNFAQNGQQKMDMPGAPQGMDGNPSQGNHALQDYQMQLMLLEQQNKKRLLMARQEQDNINHVPGTSQPGQMQFGGTAPGMSPSNGRPGPSPNPNDQMKRLTTPKMGAGNVPGSPAMAGDGNRGSPMPGNFDHNGVPQNMRQQMFAAQQGMMQGQQPPSSHPNFQQMQMGNVQSMEQMRMAAAQQGRMPNGQPWPQGTQPMMQTPSQQGQVGTPQQRTNMPPPPAPNAEQQRTQPSSPAPTGGPATPSQAPKPNPKAKKEVVKKNVPQKGATKKDAATPAATDAPAATPTPSTPITPMHPTTFQNKAGTNTTAGGPPAPQQAAPTAVPAIDPTADFGLPPGDGGFDLSFTTDGQDVLENFDFDSFLHNTDETNSLGNFDFIQFNLDTEASAGS